MSLTLNRSLSAWHMCLSRYFQVFSIINVIIYHPYVRSVPAPILLKKSLTLLQILTGNELPSLRPQPVLPSISSFFTAACL